MVDLQTLSQLKERMPTTSPPALPFMLPLAAKPAMTAGDTAASKEAVSSLILRFARPSQTPPAAPSPAPMEVDSKRSNSNNNNAPRGLLPVWQVLKCTGPSVRKPGDLADFVSMDWKDQMPAIDNPRADSLRVCREQLQVLAADSGEENPDMYRLDEIPEDLELLTDDPFRNPDGSNKAERDALNYASAVLERRGFNLKAIHTFVHRPQGVQLDGTPFPTVRVRQLFAEFLITPTRSYDRVLSEVYNLGIYLYDALEGKHALAEQSKHKLSIPVFQYLIAALLSEPVNKEESVTNENVLFDAEPKFALRDALGVLAYHVIESQLYDKRAMLDNNVFQMIILALSVPTSTTGYLPYLLPGTRTVVLMLLHRMSIDSLIETIGASAENMDTLWGLMVRHIVPNLKEGKQDQVYQNLPKFRGTGAPLPAKHKRMSDYSTSDMRHLLHDKTPRDTVPVSRQEAKLIYEGKEVKTKTKTPVLNGLMERLIFLAGDPKNDKPSPCEYLMWGNMNYAFGIQFHLSYCYMNNCRPEDLKTVPIELLKTDQQGFNVFCNELARHDLMVSSKSMIEGIAGALSAKDEQIAILKRDQNCSLETLNLRAEVAMLKDKLEHQSLTLERAATESNLAVAQEVMRVAQQKDEQIAQLSRENSLVNSRLVQAETELKTREEQFLAREEETVKSAILKLRTKLEYEIEAEMAERTSKLEAEMAERTLKLETEMAQRTLKLEAEMSERTRKSDDSKLESELKAQQERTLKLESELKAHQERADRIHNQLFDVQTTKHSLESKLAAAEERLREYSASSQETSQEESKSQDSPTKGKAKSKGKGKARTKGKGKAKNSRNIASVYEKEEDVPVSPSKRAKLSSVRE